MEFFRIKKDIPFMRYAPVFNVISLLTFVVAVLFLAFRGLNFSVEFTGGTLIEASYDKAVPIEAIPPVETLRQLLARDGYPDAQVQNFGNARDILIRLTNRGEAETAKVRDQIEGTLKKIKDPEISVNRVEFVGPQVGKELATDGAMALLLVVIGIMAYLAMRFEWRFALSSIIANMHDVVIILGFFAFFQWEFSLPVLAAVLAVMGYSVNESVVVFDRVRETFRKRRDLKTPEVLNHAITSTISRTVITHGSTQVMVLSMLLFGGETLFYFALALTIGICFGIYSSVLVASPLVMWLGVSREQFAKAKVQKQEAVV
jgi:preprotein translocase subunit SecF